MGNILEKVRNYMLGVEEEDDYEYVEVEEREEKVVNAPSYNPTYNKKNYQPSGGSTTSSKIVNFKNNVQMEVVISFPSVVSDATSVCNSLRENKTCVVNLEGVDRSNAQRIADFLGGVAYALDADIQRISNEIFIMAPVNVNVSGEVKEELKANGLIFSWANPFGK